MRSVANVLAAGERALLDGLHQYDATIIESTLSAECEVRLTEDPQDGSRFDRLMVRDHSAEGCCSTVERFAAVSPHIMASGVLRPCRNNLGVLVAFSPGRGPNMSEWTYAWRVGLALHERGRLLRLTQAEVADLAGTTLRSVSLAESGQACGLALFGEIAHVLGLELLVQAWDSAPSWVSPTVRSSSLTWTRPASSTVDCPAAPGDRALRHALVRVPGKRPARGSELRIGIPDASANQMAAASSASPSTPVRMSERSSR